ncbi:hypothetical protein EJ06DRAFT_530763 [Trichodelitschia bisporula]|uniref:Uncharacterized protein n=1 Tax=Trichodelitschia bisporula TaxID=703511 RepID=A0A6G1HVM5_9PEZI|nr:hypothetical protein EJ06DRAFT_530763 [Trichodelitschia bisporula]
MRPMESGKENSNREKKLRRNDAFHSFFGQRPFDINITPSHLDQHRNRNRETGTPENKTQIEKQNQKLARSIAKPGQTKGTEKQMKQNESVRRGMTSASHPPFPDAA